MPDLRDRRSTGFGRPQAKTLAIAGILGAAWVGGSVAGHQKFDPQTGVSPLAATHATSAFTSAKTGVSWDLPNLDNPRVKHFIDIFTTSGRDRFARYLSQMGRYAPMISAKLEERGMPQDLIYLAMIESGFNPTAYSSADASGLWQFIEGTATRFGLDVNRAVDERNDPEKATDAALDYLSQLHDQFGSWYLAAAAYNTGENRVARIMKEETGSVKGNEMSYYEIADRLPKETADYVPLMIAAARIAKQPAKYGFGNVPVDTPLSYEEIVVDPATPLDAIAEATGTTVKDIKELNPQLRLNRTRNDQRSVVRVPRGTRTAFLVNWPQVRQKHTPSVREYKIRRGDSLLAIAKRFDVSVQDIRDANDLRGNRIIAGRTLQIPENG
ncbi:MAG TPA: transglycosylase SLT domain-containing protein [Longimicrobiaceae bacterium]|nr:transglycosylase SLT domain-containing protein [Longimicrobiaceae bacterium]